MNHRTATTGRSVQTVAADCLGCGAHKPIKVPAAVWQAWKQGEITTKRAFATIDATDRRWITNAMCPNCFTEAVTHNQTTTYFDAQCPGCNKWESFGVPAAALTAYRNGELSDHQAFPHHTHDQRTMIECGWHPQCFDTAANRPNDGTHQPIH